MFQGLSANKTLRNKLCKTQPAWVVSLWGFSPGIHQWDTANPCKMEVIIRLDWTCFLRFSLRRRSNDDIRGAFSNTSKKLTTGHSGPTAVPQRSHSGPTAVGCAATCQNSCENKEHLSCSGWWLPPPPPPPHREADTITNSAVRLRVSSRQGVQCQVNPSPTTHRNTGHRHPGRPA